MGIEEEENRKILELVNTPALDWLGQGGADSGGRNVKGGKYGRTSGGRPNKTPPEGYLCHRCHVGGHFIQHCPTNGDPNYDVKRVKAATGIPKSMLKADPEGRYVLSTGEVAVIEPNEDIFEKEMEGIPSRRPSWSVNDVPTDLLCPLCKKLMKDAVLASKCCFKSFCGNCIRDHLINSRLRCECGATDMLTDYLIPNMTVRRAINRILDCDTSSSSSGGGGSNTKSTSFHVQDFGSFVRCPSQTSKVSSNTPSASSSSSSSKEDRVNALPQMAKRARIAESADVSKATVVPLNVKETAPKGDFQGMDEEVDQKLLVSDENGRKRKRNVSVQDSEASENYMVMPTGSGAYNSYWNGLWGGMAGSYPAPYYNDSMDGYGYGHYGMPYGETLPQDFRSPLSTEQTWEEPGNAGFFPY